MLLVESRVEAKVGVILKVGAVITIVSIYWSALDWLSFEFFLAIL